MPPPPSTLRASRAAGLASLALLVVAVAAVGACAGAAASAPVPPSPVPPTILVEVPPPLALPAPVAAPVAPVTPVAPLARAAGDGPEDVPAWHPPPGHLDPCATWTSEKTLFDCDAENEFPPDAGALHARKAR